MLKRMMTSIHPTRADQYVLRPKTRLGDMFMKKYVFKDIKFDWQLLYVFLGIIVSVIAWTKCAEKKEWSNIFEKECIVEYKVLSKQRDSRYDDAGNMVLKNTKSGEMKLKGFRGKEEYLIFETVKPGDIVKFEATYGETLSQDEKDRLWEGKEPIGCTWLFPLFYGLASLIGLMVIDDCDDIPKILFSAGFIFFVFGVILGVFV